MYLSLLSRKFSAALIPEVILDKKVLKTCEVLLLWHVVRLVLLGVFEPTGQLPPGRRLDSQQALAIRNPRLVNKPFVRGPNID